VAQLGARFSLLTPTDPATPHPQTGAPFSRNDCAITPGTGALFPPEWPRLLVRRAHFAGLNAAHALRQVDVDVTVLDKNNYHTFQPLLYQVSTGYLAPEDVGAALRAVFRRQPNVHVRVGEVVSVNWPERQLLCQDGFTLGFDYLIAGSGCRNEFFNVAGMREHGWPLYTLTDAVRLRSHLLNTLERAAKTASTGDPRITTVVVGGGPTGVETAGAVTSMAHEVIGPAATLAVTLVEAGLVRFVASCFAAVPRVCHGTPGASSWVVLVEMASRSVAQSASNARAPWRCNDSPNASTSMP
jgi:NADPH-dependent 2,4-dienoyl-CoA reductase/sulfur reductase-like enzyme